MQTAIVQFSLRTFFRSRQHRVILAFYLGIGFALTILLMQTRMVEQLSGVQSNMWREPGVALLASSILMIGFCILGMQAASAIPVDLGANWIFRITAIERGRTYLSARRRAILVSAGSIWAGWAILLLWNWPFWPAAGHLLVLGLLGSISVELCLLGPQKIPFTCSYLPGKSNFHMSFWVCIGAVLVLVFKCVAYEQRALQNLTGYIVMVVSLAAITIALRRHVTAEAGKEPQFEDLQEPALFALDLHQDGVPPVAVRTLQ